MGPFINKTNQGLLLPPPPVAPVLDPDFRPAALAARSFRERAANSGASTPVRIALEQPDGAVFHFETAVFDERHPDAAGNFAYIERLVKFLLWSRGGFRILFNGPARIGSLLRARYTCDPSGRFDADIMGRRIYERPFEVIMAGADEQPPPREASAALGRHLNGCRIGFDLGASDRKAAAVIDGHPVFSEEIAWDPSRQSDPQWHFDEIMDSLKRAARHLPRVDAIGGSSAGVFVNNRVKVASLFRGVPPALFETRVKGLFLEIKRAWGGIPFELANDGEVAALAGSMSIGAGGVLGLALGSSQAAGFVTDEGAITSWLNELAFAPIDYDPGAPVDEWSGDYGCGVQYLSQQCVSRLLPKAGIEADSSMPLPERLKMVQDLMAREDARALKIYQTIGACLGYAIAHYADFYALRHALILGRVTTGDGGQVILDAARDVLRRVFPELSERIAFHIPDEKDKRHGQAVAAASLPVVE